ncbi:MAG: hypothetical protein HY936_02015 [Nitrosomonadales bacterium]|nr:hypothetical protein [Nitrosomonadales bacterium]
MNPELERHIAHIEGLTDLHLSMLKDTLLADSTELRERMSRYFRDVLG